MKKHPEQLENEILLVNIKEGETWFKNTPPFIKSLRLGKVAYSTGFKAVVPGFHPLFGVLKHKRGKNHAQKHLQFIVEMGLMALNKNAVGEQVDFKNVIGFIVEHAEKGLEGLDWKKH